MQYIKSVILLTIALISFVVSGQEKDQGCAEYEPIEMYNLKRAIIDEQNLEVWPSIVEIRNLSDLNTNRKDSLILFIAETDNGDKLRLTNTADLSIFAELEYNDDCAQDGTILTDLKLGKINLTDMKAEIYCRKVKYAELKLQN